MKKAFQRRCVSCSLRKNKYELIRIVRTKDNEVMIDITGKTEGRGAYICNQEDCLEKEIKRGNIFRVLKTNANKKIYEDIRGVILDREKKRQNQRIKK